MKPKNQSFKSQATSRTGFTLLELMVAMVIMTIAMSIAFEAFSGTIRGWKRGTEVVEGIKHGDFAMTQLANALNSTIYFFNPRKSYAFKIEKGSGSGLPNDTISFVTASSAFMPDDSPLRYGPHRIKLFIDDIDGAPALYSIAFPAIADEEEVEDEYDAQPHLVSRSVQGLEILVYDEELEDWSTDEWEPENSVPERVKISVFVASEDENDEPIVFSRVLEIPVAPSVKLRLENPSKNAQNNSQSQKAGAKPAPSISRGGAPPPRK